MDIEHEIQYTTRSNYIDDFEFDVGDKFTYEYNFFQHFMHDIRVEDIKDLPATKNVIFCIGGAGMPGATKQDETDIKFSLLKKIVKKKGKLSYQDISDFQEKIKRVKFIKKNVNLELAVGYGTCDQPPHAHLFNK